MLPCNDIARIAGLVKSAAASTETQFDDIGSRLGTAVDVIGTLSQTFDLLSSELQGENLAAATHALSRIMPRVSALTGAGKIERDSVGRLMELTKRVQQRVVLMSKAVSGIGMLAINARIEAASIGEAGSDFASFATEINQTLKHAQISLQHLTRELAGVTQQLRTAAAGQLALTQHQKAALRLIPIRLDASISEIIGRGERATAATGAVTQKTREVVQRISSTVAGLQIGDITRQRLEHVGCALDIVGEILAPAHASQSDGNDLWAEMTDPSRWGLVVVCCRLQSAQLLDAADEFDQETRRIRGSIQALAADAKQIFRLGNAAAGASETGRGTFLAEVEGSVAEVSELLDGLARARREADEVATAVSDATKRLVGYASTLQSLEGDIRIMGLNTSLKCGRLGPVGRPLMIIAQELRAYANQIAVDASAVTQTLDNMVVAAGSLSRGDQEESAGDISAVASDMAESISRLDAVGQSLADALGVLARDTEGVSGLLLGGVASVADHDEFSKRLRQAATDLAGVAANAGGIAANSTADEDRLLDILVRIYTMDRERVVHDRNSNGRVRVGKPLISPSAARPAGVDALEDFFL